VAPPSTATFPPVDPSCAATVPNMGRAADDLFWSPFGQKNRVMYSKFKSSSAQTVTASYCQFLDWLPRQPNSEKKHNVMCKGIEF
jgi:hypothetical protein